MISNDEMFDPLLSIAPGFSESWDAFVEEWKEEDGDLPVYLVMPDLARPQQIFIQ